MIAGAERRSAAVARQGEGSAMRIESVCILGGTGFVGRHICSRLAGRKLALRVLTRNRERQRDMLVIPNLQLMEADVHDPQALRAHFSEVDCVINLVGILNDPDRQGRGFQRVHAELPRKVVEACRQTGVQRLLHMSALGAAAEAPSMYQRSKAEGERSVLAANGEHFGVTGFRPSVIFGPGDSFFSRFAKLLRLSPGIFPLPTPDARFSPVYVDDVADAFINSLENRATFGRSLELCGPESYTLHQLVEYTARVSGHRRRIVGLSDRLSRLQAHILGRLPGQPYSVDNYLSATADNTGSCDGLHELGIDPVAIEAVVPGYLSSFGARRRYNVFRKGARRV
jgi:uncharacterized protein YbjT (DUF2867 family)